MHVERLQNAIKVTVNDQLLFPSGDWQMPANAQQTMAKMAPILAPMQQTKIAVNGYTDNVPIGLGLKRLLIGHDELAQPVHHLIEHVGGHHTITQQCLSSQCPYGVHRFASSKWHADGGCW